MPVSTFSVDDFLRGSMSDIWDRKLIGRVADYYCSNVVVHLPGNETHHGSEAVITAVTAWLSAFPDAQPFVDSVIWNEDAQEYRTSVRSTLVGHNTGPSVFGTATGRRIVVSTVVNSRIRNERFVEQWIEYDEVGLIEQLGFDVRAVLQHRSQDDDAGTFGEDLGRGVSAWGSQTSTPHLLDEGKALNGRDLVHAAVGAIWNGRLVGTVPQFYAEQYRARVNARQLFGYGELQAQVLEMVSAVPDLRVHIDEVICREESDGQHTSSRWTLLGTNTGPSRYAQPSNRYLRLTGITNHHIVNNRFRAGWTAYDELSLRRQLSPKNDLLLENTGYE